VQPGRPDGFGIEARLEDRLVVGIVVNEHLMDEEPLVRGGPWQGIGVRDVPAPVGVHRAPRVGTPPDTNPLHNDHGEQNALWRTRAP
jgi:hypothetical protein